MPAYQAPLRDMRFLLYELHGADALAGLPGYEEATRDLLDSVLDAAATFTAEKLLPLNRTGDEEGCRFQNGIVTTPAGFKEAYKEFAAGGWISLAADPAYGGQGLPHVLNLLVEEMICATNLAFGMYPGPEPGRLQRARAPRLRRDQAALSAEARRRVMGRHHVPDRAAMRHRPRPGADQGRGRARWQLPRQRQQDLHLGRRA